MHFIGVVPIFMSAGAAALPTILAAVTGIVAIVLKPRELVRLIKEKPLAVGATAITIVGLAGAIAWWMNATPSSLRPTVGHTVVHHDWTKVALDLIAQEQAGKTPTAVIDVVEMDAPLVLGHDYSRSSCAGTISSAMLRPLWTYKPENTTMFLSFPAVAGKRLYVAGCEVGVNGYSGVLACLDADTGTPIWKTTTIGDDPLKPFFSSPAITKDGRSLLIGQGLHEDHDCSLLCFDTSGGQLRWAVKTTQHIESSPAIFGDTVVVGAGAIEGKDGKPVGDPGFAMVVRISDGAELFRVPVNDPESSPAIDEQGIAYVGSGFNGSAIVGFRTMPNEELVARKLDRVVWKTAVEQPITSSITLARDIIYAGGGNSDFVYANPHPHGIVVALDRKTGTLLWQTHFEDAVLGGVAFRDGKLFCPVRNGDVAALNASDGKILWRSSIGGKSPVVAGCAVTDRAVYAVTSAGYLAVIDPSTGKIREKIFLNDQSNPGTGLTVASPQVVDGRLIVGSETGGLHAFVGSEGSK